MAVKYDVAFFVSPIALKDIDYLITSNSWINLDLEFNGVGSYEAINETLLKQIAIRLVKNSDPYLKLKMFFLMNDIKYEERKLGGASDDT